MLTRRGGYLRWVADDSVPAASRQLQNEGWVLLRSVLDHDEVAALARSVDEVFRTLPGDRRRPDAEPALVDQFRYEMLNRSSEAQQVLGNRRILDVIEPLLGEDCHVIANTAWRNPPNIEHTHGGGFWHIDAGPHVPLPPGVDWDEAIPHPVFAVAAHVLLQDCPIECGPTGVIPRSHLSGEPPPADRRADPSLRWRDRESVVLEAAAGDVQLFVSDVWHRRMPTGPGDAGRFFLQIHYGRRDIAQRLRTTEESNQLSPAAIDRAGDDRGRTLIGLHSPFFYDG